VGDERHRPVVGVERIHERIDERRTAGLTRPPSFSHLAVRLGTIIPTGATTREMMDALALWIFDGRPSGWAGSWIRW
jgi:hypothetical protein